VKRPAESEVRPEQPLVPSERSGDGIRRARLAAERTWLAWWRTGLAVSAVALAVGRLLPGVTHGALWPLRVLGAGYGVLALCVFMIGAWRQQRIAAALSRGSFDEVSRRVVIAFTVFSTLLAVGTLLVILIPL